VNQPLIILGMHRSGTSMLSRILRHQGIFLGHRIQGDDEATFFVILNRWMLHMAGTEWDNPAPALAMLQDPENISRLERYLRQRMSGPRTWSYLGSRILEARGRIGPELPFAWGFKDPRSSIFLPVWLRLFPHARLLRIRRHGIDVAASLRARYRRNRVELDGKYQRLARLGLDLPKRPRVMEAVRCATIEGGLGIWAEYEGALDNWLAEASPERQMTIRYEDYVVDPAAHHAAIGAFLGHEVSRPLPPGIYPDPERAFAFRQDSELVSEAQRLEHILEPLGYAGG
jgi:hypothetical protein